MKVIVLRKSMVDVLKKVGNYITTKVVNTSLSHVKLQTTIDNKLLVVGGNHEVLAEIEIDALEIFKNGSVLVPFKKLSDFVKKAKSDALTIEEIEDGVNIQACNIDYKLNTVDVENYPKLPNEGWFNFINLLIKILMEDMI